MKWGRPNISAIWTVIYTRCELGPQWGKSLRNTKSYYWKGYLQWDRTGMYYYFKSLNKSKDIILCPKNFITDGWQGFYEWVVQGEKKCGIVIPSTIWNIKKIPWSTDTDLNRKVCRSVNSFPSQINHSFFSPINQQFFFVGIWSNINVFII